MKMIALAENCVRTRGAECRRCAIACPVGAISFDAETNGPVIDEKACTKCGLCMGVCDAFSSTTTNSQRLYDHLRKVAMRGELVYVTCKENIFPGFEPAENVTVLPCIGCMPPELWTLLLAENAPICIACDLRYCDDCSRAPGRGELLFTHAVEMAETWTGRETHFDREIPEKQATKDNKPLGEYGRREAFDSVKDDALDIVSGRRRLRNSDTLKEYYLRKERQRMRDQLKLHDSEKDVMRSKKGGPGRIMMPRRRMLLEAIEQLPEMAERVTMTVSFTDTDACVSCHDCTECCISGARALDSASGVVSYDVRYCIGCGACVDACPVAAITMIDATAQSVMPNGPGEVAPILVDGRK
ncbi:Uncharacterized Fe-S center protein [Slackia heliotrinireducens]|uniref:2-oxoacid:ferredoxin oxidoreductase, delta subunit n=1 Tax=Slackia heliotrinireducens (strain ATCC 29202 / DSM 20476 / NCTC 11029 / RHS 1) TaxID=471855 RepID=C7N535_SLAHD|nr:4Fe-4S dicluster domain-containing protein [Slackia heliotrinireducens]ACV22020.1 2-oxoacid:ferredoxin oxidoreductase, delta subunit [Slackia heliotrinireducens DSM 20476]VEG99943.1 Uncharacterized Fe-S center protein [Slackia heliotrinireducens]